MMGPVRAVLFDLDGTLYHQEPLRLLMALELAALPMRVSTTSARRTWSAIRGFRRVREELRDLGAAEAPLSRLQFERAAERGRMEVGEVEAVVSEWIFRRPLKYLRRCRRAGIESLLDSLASRAIPAGVFSDYPAREKLEALRLAQKISLVACATIRGDSYGAASAGVSTPRRSCTWETGSRWTPSARRTRGCLVR
jgi:beta-phosphoglucomutase-like phosphatase (HAD superfamily)